MKSFAVENIVDILKQETFRLIPSFVRIAQIIIGIFLAIELVKEAITLAHGGGFHLSKKLITWVLAMVMISAFYYNPSSQSGLANGIYETGRKFGEHAFTRFDEAVRNFVDNTAKDMPSFGLGSVFKPKKLIFALGLAISIVIGGICFLLIYVMICGSYGSLALLIVLGPIAFAFMLNDDFRLITFRWINSVITTLLLIIVYGVTMMMVAGVLSATLKSAVEAVNSFSLLISVLLLLLGPMLALGLTMQGPKTVMSVFGGVGGGGETAAGFLGGVLWSAAAAYGKSVIKGAKIPSGKGSGGTGGGGGQGAIVASGTGAAGGGTVAKGGEAAPGAALVATTTGTDHADIPAGRQPDRARNELAAKRASVESSRYVEGARFGPERKRQAAE